MKGETTFPARVWEPVGNGKSASRPETKTDRKRRIALAESLNSIPIFNRTLPK